MSRRSSSSNPDPTRSHAPPQSWHNLARTIIAMIAAKNGECIDFNKALSQLKVKRSECLEYLEHYRQIFSIQKKQGTDQLCLELPVKICPDYCSESNCLDRNCNMFHICKFFILSNGCTATGKTCKFGHDIDSHHNSQVCRKLLIENLWIDDIRKLVKLPRNRNKATIPGICSYYNVKDGCSKRGNCISLHVCEHYFWGNCKFGYRRCKRSHNILDNAKILERFGINTDQSPKAVLNELKDLYDMVDKLNERQDDSEPDDYIPDFRQDRDDYSPDYRPDRDDYSPERDDYSPERDNYSPERRDYIPDRDDHSPDRDEYQSSDDDQSQPIRSSINNYKPRSANPDIFGMTENSPTAHTPPRSEPPSTSQERPSRKSHHIPGFQFPLGSAVPSTPVIMPTGPNKSPQVIFPLRVAPVMRAMPNPVPKMMPTQRPMPSSRQSRRKHNSAPGNSRPRDPIPQNPTFQNLRSSRSQSTPRSPNKQLYNKLRRHGSNLDVQAATVKKEPEVCKYYMKGICRYKNHCRNLHPPRGDDTSDCSDEYSSDEDRY